MKTLARNVPFLFLTLAAVAALIATSWLFAGVAAILFPALDPIDGAPARIAAAVVTLGLWALWFGVYRLRLRAETAEAGGPASPPDIARNRYMMLHVILVFAFLGAVFGGEAIARSGDAAALRLAGLALPALVLAIWAWAFVHMLLRLDEMMQAAHYRALAVAGGVTLLLASLHALCETMLGASPFHGVLLLPAYAIAYAAALGAQGVRA